MSISDNLLTRSHHACELCSEKENLAEYLIPPKPSEEDDNKIVACSNCLDQINGTQDIVIDHWRCLNESIWSEVSAVKVMSYRILKKIETESWAQDLLSSIYLEEQDIEWAEMGLADAQSIVHKDSNGQILQAGDSVVLIKDLNVKGANFTAKRGTAVRRISLVKDNAEHIEGRVNDQHIVILTKYVKKT